jgi:hypothetical protein
MRVGNPLMSISDGGVLAVASILAITTEGASLKEVPSSAKKKVRKLRGVCRKKRSGKKSAKNFYRPK